MDVSSDIVRMKIQEKQKEFISCGLTFEQGRLSLDLSFISEIEGIVDRLNRGEITNEQAIAELDAITPELVMSHIEECEQAKKAEEDKLRSRTQKGSSLLKLLDSYTVIDLETTGLDPLYDSIIEVAAIRIDKGQVVDQFTSLINTGYEINEYITRLTGITNDMIAVAPTLEELLPQFLEFIGDSIIVGHNVNFDINFLYTACTRYQLKPFSNDYVDTMRFSRRLFPNERRNRLIDLVIRFNLGDSEEHRALGDAFQTNACYVYMKDYMEKNQIPLSAILPAERFSAECAVSSKRIVPDQTAVIDESSPFYQKIFVFTGTLERMVRKDAMQLVVNHGGICKDGVTKDTNYLVLGNNDYCSSIRNGKSTKQKKAEELQLKGYDISIISENVFYMMLNPEK